MAREKTREPAHIETAFDPDDVYAESDSPGPDPTKKKTEVVINGIRGGWIPYRGVEQHGVQAPQIPFPVDDWEADVTYEIDTRSYNRPHLRDAEPNATVRGWSDELAVVTKANSFAITLQRNQWTRILNPNPRRVLLSFWIGITPASTDVIYFQTGRPIKVLEHNPRIQNGGQQSGIYQFLFTDEFNVYASTSTTDYTISVIEEYEVEA